MLGPKRKLTRLHTDPGPSSKVGQVACGTSKRTRTDFNSAFSNLVQYTLHAGILTGKGETIEANSGRGAVPCSRDDSYHSQRRVEVVLRLDYICIKLTNEGRQSGSHY